MKKKKVKIKTKCNKITNLVDVSKKSVVFGFARFHLMISSSE